MEAEALDFNAALLSHSGNRRAIHESKEQIVRE